MKIENLERAAELNIELKQMEAAISLLKKSDCRIVVESKDGHQRAELPHSRFYYDTLYKANGGLNAIRNEIRDL